MNILRPFPTWEKSPNLRKYKYQCPLAVYDKEIIRSWYLRTNPDLRVSSIASENSKVLGN